jgi:putative ABC transport system substrate-binding protein
MRFECPSVVATAKITLVVTTAALVLGMATQSLSADERTPRIAVLMSREAPPYESALKGFQQQLERDGVQAHYDVVVLRGNPVESAEAVDRVARNGPHLLYSLGAVATQAVIDAKLEMPLVACLLLTASDLEKLPRATGVTLEVPVETQFQWMQRFLPKATRIGVLYNAEENQIRIDAAVRVAHDLGLTLSALPIATPRDIPNALSRLANEVDVLWGLPDHLVLSPETAQALLLFSLRNRIPFVGMSTAWAKAGALYALDRDYTDLGAQCGDLALRVLKGQPPDSLPLASPRILRYAINLKTARHMKITLPEPLVRGAADRFE